ncbi:MAG: TonB-dependent receptor, partial [Bacteroidota bacterium]
VALRSKDPEFSWGGAARLTGGNQENREVAVAFTGPLIADQLAFRISGEYQFLDTGFRYPRLDALNLGGSDDLVRSEYANVKARLLFTPKGVPELSARLSYSFANDRPTLLLQATGPDFEARESFAPYATLEDGTVHNAALELGYGLTEAITLTSVSAFHSGGRDRDGLRFIDPDPTLIIPVGSKGDLINSDFTQELRLNYETDRTQAVIGGYFGHFDSDSENRNLGDIFPIVEGLIAEAVGGPVPPAEILYDAYTDFETVVDNIAVFGEVNQEVTEALKVTVGLRYDNENFTQSSESVADVSADPQAFGMFTPIILGVLRAQIQEPPTNPETTYSAFLPKVGLAYDVTSDLTVGATVQRGYRSGGAQILVNGELNVFDPEYTWNYEVSLRSRWLNGRLTANVNAFYMDWTDQQLSVPIEGTTLVRTANAGASTLYGFEMELRAIPVLGLTLFSSLGIVETEFDEFILNGVDLSGFSFPSSAGESYSIGFLYRPGNGLANGFFATADVSHTGSYFSAVGTGSDGQNDPDLKAGDYTVVNARVGYEYGFRGRMLGVSLFARNLFDEPVELQAVTGGFGGRVVQFGLPAVYGVTLDVDF